MNSKRSFVPVRLASVLKVGLLALVGIVVTSIAASGCLDRPVCDKDCRPRTTNVFVDDLTQKAVDKIDLLFMIDNSVSMADKQEIMKLAVPDLVTRLVNPVCVSPDGQQQQVDVGALCPDGFKREFNPVKNIHIGIITSSLGTPGDQAHAFCKDADEQRNDHAYLLGSLPRGQAASQNQAFLAWGPDSDLATFNGIFSAMVPTAGEQGCGYEASLESWYRFLADPAPYQTVVVGPCGGGNPNQCAQPSGTDQTVLDQRGQFLRPDSLVAIVMLSDENDCSMQFTDQNYYMGQDNLRMWKGSSACTTNPNDPCCYSCGQVNPPGDCPADPACATDQYLTQTQDHPNLRCFNQKKRFGVDFLYPTQRYVNALTKQNLCITRPDLDPANCATENKKPNPLLKDGRDPSLVFLAGIIGVPWEDIQAKTDANGTAYPDTELHYKTAAQLAADNTWDTILGDPNQSPPKAPGEPLMIEQQEPRGGTTAVTMQALASPTAGYLANSTNGHEWNASLNFDLQYSCIMPIPSSLQRDCSTVAADRGCDCFPDYLTQGHNNPLCQLPDNTYSTTQRFAKAFPGIRELQVLKDFGNNSIVASICARNVDLATQNTAQDFGYRPAIAAIVDRLKEALKGACLPREIAVENGKVPCLVIEAIPKVQPCAAGRKPVRDSEVIKASFERLEQLGKCGKDATTKCDTSDWTLCEIQQAGDACLNEVDDTKAGLGWCYVDPAKGLGTEELVKDCPETQQRLLRLVSDDTNNPLPANNSTVLIACLGAELLEGTGTGGTTAGTGGTTAGTGGTAGAGGTAPTGDAAP